MKLLNAAFELLISIISPIAFSLLILGLVAGVLKASTQIEDRSLGFALKFFVVFLLCYFFADNWSNNLLEFTKEIWSNLENYKPIT